MALQPEELDLLVNINREVGETKVAIKGLSARMDAHVAADTLVHERLRARISPLQAEGKASTVKHRVAIGLGLAGVGAGGAGAAEPGWFHALFRLFTDG